MEPAPSRTPPPAIEIPPPSGLRTAMELLLEAYECAQELKRDPWDFAVEIEALKEVGLTRSLLRWLLCQGHIEQAIENTRPQAARRTFRIVRNLSLSRRACLMLTDSGADLARRTEFLGVELFRPEADGNRTGEGVLVPHWDSLRRELRLRNHLIKQFKVPAPNQEIILSVFEEEGWPACIDDPLSNDSSQDPKERLHDTIKSLNRSQVKRLIHFRGNGNGSGVRWEYRS